MWVLSVLMRLIERENRTFSGAVRRGAVTVCLSLSALILFLLLLSSCSKEQRHRVLAFFFEGVPSLDGSDSRNAFRTSTWTNVDAVQARVKKGRGVTGSSQARGSSHEPVRDCERCHGRRTSGGKRGLVEPVPDLCYSCHEKHGEKGKYVHGPVGVGECLYCHDPHQSGYVNLQKMGQPDLCFQCHSEQSMDTIPGHHIAKESICTECHDLHRTDVRVPLKNNVNLQNDPNSVKLSN